MKTKLVNKVIHGNFVNELLKERGLTDEELDYFLNVPDDSALQDPAALDNIDEACAMFDKMINLGADDRICLVVDCDVDGFTSAAIFMKYYRHYNEDTNVMPIFHEGKGHGLADTYETIVDAYNDYPNIKFVVLPDAGSNDYEYHEKLGEMGIHSLMLDHHIVEEDTKFSDYAVIVNNQSSKNYVNKDLCGAGVTWQFCRYCDRIYGKEFANQYMDLAALGIISDMMSMLSLENRYIVHTGLQNINNYYFQTICAKQSFSMGGKVNPTTVAFYVTPLINSLMRVGTMDEKKRCFLAFVDGHQMVECHKRGAAGTYEEVAIESTRECVNARSKQNRILDKVVEELEIKIAKYDLLENKILTVVLEDEDFPAELNGLCAMKLAAKYKRPTIVARLNNEGYIRGSSRGLNESALKSFKDFMNQSTLFEYTAGHDNACGISIAQANLDSFNDYANAELADVDFGENWYEINFERFAAESDMTFLISDIAEHEDIFGQGNPEPLIHVTDINVNKTDLAIIGKNADTVRIEKFGITYLKFHAKDMIEELKQYDFPIKLEVVGKANMNEWGGYYTPQIFINDYQISDNTLGF